MVSGARDIYSLVHFDVSKRQLVVDSEPQKLHWGKSSYAAQIFANHPDRTIKMAFQFASAYDTPFNCKMSIPTELTLVKLDDRYYLRGLPGREFDALVKRTDLYYGKMREVLSQTTAYDVTIKLPMDAPDFQVDVFGINYEVKPKENLLVFGDHNTPLTVIGKEIEIRMILDTISVEVYFDHGLAYAVFDAVLDKNLNKLVIDSDFADITVKELDSIWH